MNSLEQLHSECHEITPRRLRGLEVYVFYDEECAEYIVAPYADPVTWYYTDDVDDALDTAQVEASKRAVEYAEQ